MPDPFHKRFNIDVPIDEARRRFINRIDNKVGQVVSSHDLIKRWDPRFSARAPSKLDFIMTNVEIELGELHIETTAYPGQFTYRWRALVNDEFSRCLHAIEALHKSLSKVSQELADYFGVLVTQTIMQSEVDLSISWQIGFFSKKGAELLDTSLVNEPLCWLADPKYETALVPFKGSRPPSGRNERPATPWRRCNRYV